MCGIAGWVVSTPSLRIASIIGAMGDRIVHRGPDDHGFLLWDGQSSVHSGRALPADSVATIGLAHRRLSIIDLSETGWQPMSSTDGRYHIVYNGEIYNYVELREELLKRGHRFRGESDTEVLLAACAEWGAGVFPRLVGMFAFALLDTVEHRLLLARDFMGIKPLYYATWSGGLAFASEIKALLEVPAVSARVNPQSLHDYLRYGSVDQGRETMFADIRQFPAAHHAWIDLDRPEGPWSPQRYWTLGNTDSGAYHGSLDSAAEELRGIFLENVRLHLRSDVPVGSALSGGIDSSSIVAAVRELGGSAIDLRAIGYVAADPRISEERWIDLAADAASARVHKVSITPEELKQDLDSLIGAQDEPFGSTSIYAQYRVFRMAAEKGLKVMLDGQGADEIFAGYMSLLPYRWAGHVRAGSPWRAVRFMRFVAPYSGLSTRRFLLRGLGALAPASLHRPLSRLTGLQVVPKWMDGAWLKRRGIDTRVSPARRGHRHDLRGVLDAALLDRSLPQLLRYEDRNSMAHSVESRVPFLTPRLVDFMQGLPESFLIDDHGLTKKVFRRAMRGIVPDPILDRRDKIGFEPPQRKWLAALDPWVRETLSPEAVERLPCLRSGEMIRRWDIVGARQGRFDWTIWRWLNAITWANLYDVEFG